VEIEIAGSLWKTRASPCVTTLTVRLLGHSTSTSGPPQLAAGAFPWSVSATNRFPPSLGNTEPLVTIDICVENPVVAPQSRWKITASNAASGEATRNCSSLLQRPQPPKRAGMLAHRTRRLTVLLVLLTIFVVRPTFRVLSAAKSAREEAAYGSLRIKPVGLDRVGQDVSADYGFCKDDLKQKTGFWDLAERRSEDCGSESDSGIRRGGLRKYAIRRIWTHEWDVRNRPDRSSERSLMFEFITRNPMVLGQESGWG
jgi:hypothetical protein